MSALVAPQKEQTRSEQTLTELPAVLGCRLYVRIARPPALPWSSVGRVCLQCGRPGFNPWVGKIPQRRAWQPTPSVLAWRIPMDRGAWRAAVQGSRSQTRPATEVQLSTAFRLLVEKTRSTAVTVAGVSEARRCSAP